jgi:hypothetical protein
MARCSCSGSNCGCTIQVGDGLELNGTGNAGAPFVISLSSRYLPIVFEEEGPVDLSAVESGTLVNLELHASVTDMILPVNSGIRIDIFLRPMLAGLIMTWSTDIIWPGGTVPAMTSTVGNGDWFAIRMLETFWIGVREGANLG